MHVVEHLVLAQGAMRAAVGEKILKLGECWKLRRAQEPRHRDRPARIGPGGASFERYSLEPSPQEARQECVSRSQHIVDFDWKSASRDAVFYVRGNGAGIDHAPHGPALQDDHGLRK